VKALHPRNLCEGLAVRPRRLALACLAVSALSNLACSSLRASDARTLPQRTPTQAANTAAPPTLLLPGQFFDRPLEGASEHRYALKTPTSRYLRFAIEQMGVEVSAVLLGPDGTTVAAADGPRGWRKMKRLSATVEQPGQHILLVRAADPTSPAGRYRLELQESRPPIPSDLNRIEAERRLATGERLLESQLVEASRAAVDQLQQSLAAWRRTGDCTGEIETLDDLSLGHSAVGDWVLAGEDAGRALSYANDIGDESAEAMALLHQARVPPPGSSEIYRDAIELATSLGLERARSEGLFQLGILEALAGNNPLALALYEVADQLLEEGDIVGHARIHSESGLMLQKLGHFQTALETLQSSIQVAHQAHDLETEANARYHLAALQLTSGRLQEALDSYRHATELNASIGAIQEQALATAEIGLTELYLGNREEARRYFAETATLYDKLPQKGAHSLKAFVILQIADVERLDGDLRSALRHGEEALASGRRLQDRLTISYALLKLGQLHSLLHEPEAALAALTEAARLARDSQDLQLLARVRIEQARVLHATGRLDSAMQYSGDALASAQGGDLEAEIHALQARIHRDQGHLEAAKASIETALAIIEGERREVASAQSQISLLASRRPSYELGIDVLMRLERSHPGAGYATEAFQASERGRARGLLDLLRETKSEQWREADPELGRRHDANERLHTELFRQMIELSVRPSQSETARRLEAALSEAQRESRLIGEEISRVKRQAFEIPDQHLVDLAGIQSLLDSRTALLEYAVGEETTFLFVVTAKELTSFDLGVTSVRLGTLLDEMQPTLRSDGRRLYATYLRTASSLYDSLIAPAEKALAGKPRLLIVPDGPLHMLSFEALLTGRVGGASVNRYDLPYLLRDRLITYLPSAAVFAQLHASRSPVAAGKLFYGVGNPLLRVPGRALPARTPRLRDEGGRERSAGTEGKPSQPTDDEGPIMRSLRQAGLDQLPPLAFAQQEITSIASHFPPDRAVIFLGADASESQVKTDPVLSTARYIHFATHGLLNDDPDLSGLLLTADGNGGEDGLLQLREVVRLKLSAALVVLSACRTALGSRVAGEGVIGLPRAFLHAGAASVLVSLWPVDDESTEKLMVGFYKHLVEAGNRGEALQRAQLEMIRGGVYSFPYYWAPFILVGLPR
jgi:CHAT domain-containing protein